MATIVLQATDLPTGWSGAPYKPDPVDAATNAAFAACLGVTPGAGGGPSNVAGTVAATVTVIKSGLTLTFYSTTVAIIGPLIETNLSFSKLGLPVPTDLQATLIGDVAARTAHA